MSEIIVQTRKGNKIDNYQPDCKEIPQSQIRLFKKLLTIYSLATPRSPIDPCYNCHGLTFASRRTWITENKDIYQILEDDLYREIEENKVLAGDIIIYIAKDGSIIHSGIVIESYFEGRKLSVPMIFSKWGHINEFIHSAINCPYHDAERKYYRVKNEN